MSLKRLVRSTIGRAVDLRQPFTTVGSNLIGRDTTGVDGVVLGGSNLVHDRVRFARSVKLGYATTIGSDCRLNGPLTIGKYTQLGPAVGTFAVNHPLEHLSIYTNERLLGGKLKSTPSASPITIGNDVWMGSGSMVMSGVTIGDGAVVGGGSIVTKDVAPYTIVVGNPARSLRARFSQEIIELLLDLRWWDRPPEELEAHADIFMIELDSPTGREMLTRWLAQG